MNLLLQLWRRPWWLLPALALAGPASAQSLTRLEYFYDTDPGYGQGTTVTFPVAGPSQDYTYTASMAGLTPGFHTLYTRVLEQQPGRRVWSLANVRPVYVGPVAPGLLNLTRLEYFFDLDPGYGQGRSVAISPPGPSIDQTYVADLSGLAPGFHTLYTRVRNAAGAWSLQNVRPLYVGPVGSAATSLTFAEYYIDTDPGYRQGTRVNFSLAGLSVDQTFTADLSAVPNGFHTLYVRVRDANRVWSLVSVRPFFKQGSEVTGPRPTLTRVRYQLFAENSGTPVGPVRTYALPAGTTGPDVDADFVADLTGAPASGNYVLRVAALDAAGIPSVEYAQALEIEVKQPLPVELVAFAATRRGPDVLTEWTTASERNSAYFALEAAPDPAAAFAEVGRVAAAGSSVSLRRYALTEAGVPTTGGLRYYRLRQVDLDGRRHYSAVRAVALAGTPADLTLLAHPNPFRTSELQVRIGSPQGGPATLLVLDLPGRQVLSRPLTLTPGDNQLSLPELASLPAGAYLLSLRQGTQARQFKLLKE